MSAKDLADAAEAATYAADGSVAALEQTVAEEIEIKQPVVSPSRKRFSVENTNIGDSLADRQLNSFSFGGSEHDRLRESAAKYWSVSDSGTPVFTSPGKLANPAAKVLFGFNHLVTSKDDLPISIAGSNNPYFEIKQFVKITGDPGAFVGEDLVQVLSDPHGANVEWVLWHDYEKWEAFVEGGEYKDQVFPGLIDQNVEYNYLAYTSPLPFSHKVLDKLSLTGCQYVKINPEYNFYIKGYEEAHRFGVLLNTPETLLPNIYAIALQKHNENSNDHLAAHISLDSTLKDAIVPEFRSVKDNYGQYFDVWTRQAQTIADIPQAPVLIY